MTLEALIIECKNKNAKAQQVLFSRYKDLLFGICVRYLGESAQAEDVFIEGFFKIFDKIHGFKHEGSFEGWMRRIMVNECLMYIRKNNNFHLTVELGHHDKAEFDENTDEFPEFEDIIEIIDSLPIGYRTVFNMYVFDNMKHREIAEHLGISINTSKSQMILAKKKILDLIKKKAIKIKSPSWQI